VIGLRQKLLKTWSGVGKQKELVMRVYIYISSREESKPRMATIDNEKKKSPV
jgi:hypothetical protein